MKAYRKKPKISKPNSMPSHQKSDDSMFCCLLPLIIVISYFVLSAIIRVTSNSGSKLDQIVCYGTLICCGIIMLLGVRDMYQGLRTMKREREKWAEGCSTGQLTILSRREAKSWWDDYANRFQNIPYSLDLEMNSDQKAVSPNQTVVSVRVSDHIYKRLEGYNSVRIYYESESPLTFLLEDEL
jgi:hypothetical protein